MKSMWVGFLCLLLVGGELQAAPSGGSSSAGRSFSSGGSKSFSSSSSPSPSKSFSSGSSTPAPSSGGKSYSSGGSSGNTSSSSKPTKTTFDTLGAKEQMKVESRQSFQKGQTPKAEYKAPTGESVKMDPKDKKIENLRGQLDNQKWVNREQRQQQFYGSYYSRPIVMYHDPYPSFFWWWMLDRSLDERATWAYHHQHDMDAARYQALLAKDSQLEARMKAMEAKGVPRDSTYVPAGMDSDLMYSNEYVDAAYNPNPPADSDSDGMSGWTVLLIIVGVLGGMAVVVLFFIWLSER